MVRLKPGITGFIYDSTYGCVEKVFTQTLTDIEMNAIDDVINENSVLFTSNEAINELFEFDHDRAEFGEGLDEVIEWVN
jgi:hypothetical protein